MSQKIEITNNWNIQRVLSNELENGNIKIPDSSEGMYGNVPRLLNY